MRFIYAFLLAMAVLSASGQSKYEEKHFTGLFVSNLDAALAWYRDKLDFEVIDTVNNTGSGYRFALLAWNGTLIEMIEHPNIITGEQIKECYPENTGIRGFFKPGFYVKDLEEYQDNLKSRNVTILYPVLKAEGFARKLRLFIIEDLEGNMIQFFNYP